MAWYNSSWSKRIKVLLSSSYVTANLTDFAFFVDLGHSSFADLFTYGKADGSDIRVTSADGVSILTHELDWFDQSGENGELYVKMSPTASADFEFYIYFGNSGASSTSSSSTWRSEFRTILHHSELSPTVGGTVKDSSQVGTALDVSQVGTGYTVSGLTGVTTKRGIAFSAGSGSEGVTIRRTYVSGDGQQFIAGETWIRRHSSPMQYSAFCSIPTGNPAFRMMIRDFNTSTAVLRLRVYGETNYESTDTFDPGSGWNHVAVCFDASTNIIRFYVNGVKLGNDVTCTETLDYTDADYLAFNEDNGDDYNNSDRGESRYWASNSEVHTTLNLSWYSLLYNNYVNFSSVVTISTTESQMTNITVTSGIASAEAFGTPVLTTGNVNIAPTGISSGEAFGTPFIPTEILVPSIISQEAFGTPTVFSEQFIVITSGIASQEAFGTLQINLTIHDPGGIISQEAFGSPIISRGPVNISPSSIVSSESFGVAIFAYGMYYINLNGQGIGSAEAFGTPSFKMSIVSVGITSAEAFGTPVLTTGNVNIAPTGISSGEAFGTPVLLVGNTNINSIGIISSETFGLPGINTGNVNIVPSSIVSAEAFGAPVIIVGEVNILPVGIVSGETFGLPILSTGGVTVQVNSILSAEAFGLPTLHTGNVLISANSIFSEESFGALIVNPGPVNINPIGILSEEEFGSLQITTGSVNVSPSGIVSEENWGSISISMQIRVDSIPSEEAFGVCSFTTGNVSIQIEGITSEEDFGSCIVRNLWVLYPESINSSEAFGVPLIRVITSNAFQTMMENDLDETFFNDTEFAEHATYEHKSGYIFDLIVIFDNEYIAVDPDTGVDFISRDPQVQCQTSKFIERIRKGDKIVIRGERYEVLGNQPDGVGVTIINIHKEKTI